MEAVGFMSVQTSYGLSIKGVSVAEDSLEDVLQECARTQRGLM